MIIHPSLERARLVTCGGRLLVETFGLIGVMIRDPIDARREWTIDGLYAPIHGRAIGGIRTKVIDQKGFISFLNQRDLEVLMGLGEPGDYCRWLGQDYVDPLDRARWIGFCLDEEDLRDDLFSREIELRFHQEQLTGDPYLPDGIELERLLHTNGSSDYREHLLIRGDYDAETGMCPDPRFETIDFRWMRSGREALVWRQV